MKRPSIVYLLAVSALGCGVFAASCSSDSNQGAPSKAGSSGAGAAGSSDAGASGSVGSSGRSGAGATGGSRTGGLNSGGQTGVGAQGGNLTVETGGADLGGEPATSGGVGGEAGSMAAGGASAVSCTLSADCALTETCQGGAVVQRCVARGAACSTNVDCHAYEYCAKNGACTPASAVGEPCSPGRRCGFKGSVTDQLYCDYFTKICTEAPQYSCISCDTPYACPDGTACAQTIHPQAGCANVPEFNVCVSVTSYGGECPGDASIDEDCWNGGRCKYAGGDILGEVYCTAPAGVGSACDNDGSNRFCAPGSYCNLQNTFGGVCVQSPGEGQNCLTPASAECAGAQNTQCSPCAAGLYCASGECTHYAATGDDCSARTCGENLKCTDTHLGGACTP